MKKLVFSVLASVALLSGCASTGDNPLADVGASLFTQTVDSKCRSELNGNATYKSISLLMTDVQKSTFEDKVCGCVAQEAPKSVSAGEMVQAVADGSARPQIVGKAVSNTLGMCVQQFIAQ